jgi:3,4-dihydroxy 2-butanone 4-phosphate synthase/GTP cyclohydrolase II
MTKVRGLALGATDGLDTFDAYELLGVQPDPREYERVGQVLRELGLTAVRLLTNNPRKIEGLERAGLGVERLPLVITPTADSQEYLDTKRDKFGHLLFAGDSEGSTSSK